MIEDPYAIPKDALSLKLKMLRRVLYPPVSDHQDYGPESVLARLRRAEEQLEGLVNRPQNVQLNYCDLESHRLALIHDIDPHFL
jgi:hypothetical protein